MESGRRAVLLVLASSLLLPSCMPDLNALSNGTAGAGGPAAGSSGTAANPGAAGSSLGGSDAAGGASAGNGGVRVDSDGGASAGVGPEGGSGDVGGGAAVGGNAGTGGSAGTAGTAGMGGGAGMSGGAGMGGAPTCPKSPVGATAYSTFDHADLLGPGFVDASSGTTMSTTKGATGSWAWDAAVGNRCPGALRFTFAFSEYVSGNPYEVGAGFYYFTPADWSNWSALHVMVQVSPSDAPLTNLRLFVISGSQYLYHSTVDASNFKTGAWNDIVLPLVAGSDYDPSSVGQIGVQAALDPAGTSDIPATPPTVDIWLDDIWLEPK